jgi:hypothetical protein
MCRLHGECLSGGGGFWKRTPLFLKHVVAPYWIPPRPFVRPTRLHLPPTAVFLAYTMASDPHLSRTFIKKDGNRNVCRNVETLQNSTPFIPDVSIVLIFFCTCSWCAEEDLRSLSSWTQTMDSSLRWHICKPRRGNIPVESLHRPKARYMITLSHQRPVVIWPARTLTYLANKQNDSSLSSPVTIRLGWNASVYFRNACKHGRVSRCDVLKDQFTMIRRQQCQ